MTEKKTEGHKPFMPKKNESTKDVIARLKRQDLLNKAVFVETEENGLHFGSTALIDKMVKISEKGQPAKTEDRGYEFVIEANTSKQGALVEWKEQVCIPWLEESSADEIEFLAKHMQRSNAAVNYYALAQERDVLVVQEAAMAEFLVAKNPEYADKLSIFQLASACDHLVMHGREEYSEHDLKVRDALVKSTEKLINGEKTIEPTLKNVLALGKIDDTIVSAGGYKLMPKFDKFVSKMELEMLQNLKAKDLQELSDEKLSMLREVADKHEDKGNYHKMLTNEVTSRLKQGKSFDSR